MSWWSRLRRWAVSTRSPGVRVFHCPACGREVRRIGGPPRPMGSFWNERDVLARCAVHGRPPWNKPGVGGLLG